MYVCMYIVHVHVMCICLCTCICVSTYVHIHMGMEPNQVGGLAKVQELLEAQAAKEPVTMCNRGCNHL